MITRQPLTNTNTTTNTSTTKREVIGRVGDDAERYFAGPKEAPTSKFLFDVPAKIVEGRKVSLANKGVIDGRKVDLVFKRLAGKGGARYHIRDRETGALIGAFFRNSDTLVAVPLDDEDLAGEEARKVTVTDDGVE